jgi:hypothetical protein
MARLSRILLADFAKAVALASFADPANTRGFVSFISDRHRLEKTDGREALAANRLAGEKIFVLAFISIPARFR